MARQAPLRVSSKGKRASRLNPAGGQARDRNYFGLASPWPWAGIAAGGGFARGPDAVCVGLTAPAVRNSQGANASSAEVVWLDTKSFNEVFESPRAVSNVAWALAQ